ncbi:M28 family metallopeptidase [Streptomyces iconiensis]|uniref:M28 family metallopeptidase n=1 Tax=Streptomyces iconiensis TaxID=1384038 RepID=A0ABT6ZRW2_9ACTN|nr:M28 family metallopeptidase [Streptomyces iconiensis]MDJ1131807.1 M28 family metallopeptidase [Streptomyces iconiensis]
MHEPLRNRPTRPKRATRARAVAALAATALAAPLLLSASTGSATASGGHDPGKEGRKLAHKLVHKTGAQGAGKHLRAFQAIADASKGNRAAGFAGHERSAKYAGKLLKAAGYKVTYQKFEFTYRETLAEKLKVLEPEQRDVPITLMTYTKSTPRGGLEAPVAEVSPSGGGADESPGCQAADYASGTFTGKIALIKRGGCSFAEKQAAAAGAGAVGAVIYNNIDGALNGTLGSPTDARVPTGGLTKADGEALSALVAKNDEGKVTINLELREHQEQRTTPNVIAETRGGDPDNVVMLGAHLDSVSEGPGINDNASGSAGILETALQLAKADRKGKHANKVRFALWSAEELGLLGAEHYVEKLPAAEREKIQLYLNFDMIASPNFGVFAYDGDDSDGTGSGPGPAGSGQLEKDLSDFLATRGLETRGTDFDGRSDYGPFIAAGIPSGGTFTGAEKVKTAEQRKLWGGTEGTAFDSCYHQACDTLKNISKRAFDANVKAIANAVGHYAWDTRSLPEVTAKDTKSTESPKEVKDPKDPKTLEEAKPAESAKATEGAKAPKKATTSALYKGERLVR